MLVVRRKVDQGVQVEVAGGAVFVKVLEISRGKVAIGFSSAQHVRVVRGELDDLLPAVVTDYRRVEVCPRCGAEHTLPAEDLVEHDAEPHSVVLVCPHTGQPVILEK